MKGLKNFDFFQKIAVDNVTQPTMIGSLLSLSAIFLIVFLLFTEIIDFFTPSIIRDTIVYYDPDQKAKINVNMNIKFFNMPCSIISVDQEDSVGNHRMDIRDTLEKWKVLPKGGETKYDVDVRQKHATHVISEINEGEGCHLIGHIPISKVPGDIHISHHNYADFFFYIKSERHDLYSKISLNHKVENIYFGDQKINSEILNRFGFDGKQHSFNQISGLPKYNEDNIKKNFDYFIKLIPHLFVDEINNEQFLGYQYSLTTRSREHNDEGREMPIIYFNYDLSPITMKITLQRKSFAHALTHICAIVGGVYVIFSILNRIFLAFLDFGASEYKGVASK